MISRLETSPEDSKVKKITLIALISFVIFTVIFAVVPGLIPSQYGILDLEFAWTEEKAGIIIDDWIQSDHLMLEIIDMILDYGYMVAYSLLLAGLTLIVARRSSGAVQTIGYYLFYIPFVAAILDAVENINMFLMVLSPANINPLFPLLASACATMKFTLIIIAIIFIITGFILYLYRRKK